MIYQRYIIVGPGRTGSHWVEQVVKFIIGYEDDSHGECPVSHTHDLNSLLTIPESLRNDYCIMAIHRRDFFARTISLVVAQHIDEWFVYSNKDIEPFDVDPDRFGILLEYAKSWDQKINDIIRPYYPHVVDLYYEDLIANYNRLEDYVAGQIGIPNTRGSKSWEINCNPRDYRQIVKNWQELESIFR